MNTLTVPRNETQTAVVGSRDPIPFQRTLMVRPATVRDTATVRTAIIVFADIVGSTALIERIGDQAFHLRATQMDTSLRAAVLQNRGHTVEGRLLGDGVLAIFNSARDAILGALACRAAARALALQLHIGIHAGDVIVDHHTIYGGAVSIAARISEACPPGDVLVSDTARGLARTSTDAVFTDRGAQTLKGVADPVRLWSISACQHPQESINDH